MSTNEYDVKILNELIDTTIDSVDGYAEAANETDNRSYAETFQSRAAERRQVVSTLQRRVRALGGESAGHDSMLASAHRMFLDLRQLLGAGNAVVVAEVERGEDYLKAQFKHAMMDQEVSPTTRLMIADVYASVRAGHEQICALKRALQVRA